MAGHSTRGVSRRAVDRDRGPSDRGHPERAPRDIEQRARGLGRRLARLRAPPAGTAARCAVSRSSAAIVSIPPRTSDATRAIASRSERPRRANSTARPAMSVRAAARNPATARTSMRRTPRQPLPPREGAACRRPPSPACQPAAVVPRAPLEFGAYRRAGRPASTQCPTRRSILRSREESEPYQRAKAVIVAEALLMMHAGACTRTPHARGTRRPAESGSRPR